MNKPDSKTPPLRWWDPLSAILLLCLMITASTRLVVTRWTESLGLTQTLVVLGVVLGLLLGISRFSGRTAAILAFLYGLVLLPWQVGFTVHTDMLYRERMAIVARRIGETIWYLVNRKPVMDNILFIALMCIVFFFISVHAAYSLTRHAAPWRIVIPAGLVMMVIHSYDPYLSRRALILAAYLLFALILVARLTFIRNRKTWQLNRTHMPPDVGFDWIRFTLAAVVIITLLAWTVPALAVSNPTAAGLWDRITHPWDVFQDKMSNMFSSLQSSVGFVTGFYGDTFTLSRGTNLSSEPIFRVSTTQRDTRAGRYYWRAYSYDRYEDGRWSSSLTLNQQNDPEVTFLDTPFFQARAEITFTVSPLLNIATLYTPGSPQWVSVPSQVYYGLDSEKYMDIAAFQALPSVFANQSYQVRSGISDVTVTELRGAGVEYPEWIQDKYLDLPENISPRTRQLAEELAAGKQTPYDIATAVTAYLRTYEYSQVIDQPPARQELLDWWLFDYRQGFCQYYASAEVVLLRLLGIPARMAVGYAEGEFVPNQEVENIPELERFGAAVPGEYVVRHLDAHAWPEVYFPGYGWVEFEPTASQDPIDRPLAPESAGTVENDPLLRPTPLLDAPEDLQDRATDNAAAAEDAREAIPVLTIGLYLGVMILVALLGYLIVTQRTKLQSSLMAIPIKMDHGLQRLGIKSPEFIRRWAAWASLSPVVRAYQEINNALRRLGSPPTIQLTPAERAYALEQIVPETKPHIRDLLSEYHRSEYSQSPVNMVRAGLAGKQVRKLSYRALVQRLLDRFRR